MNIYLKQFIKKKFKNPKSALDLGAGDFNDVAYLKLHNWATVGVDKNMGVNLEKPFKYSQYDLVYSNYVLHQIKNKNIFLKTAYNNLKVGGYFFLHTFDKSDKQCNTDLTEDSLKEIAKKIGFKNIKTKIFDFYDNEHKHWHTILELTAKK